MEKKKNCYHVHSYFLKEPSPNRNLKNYTQKYFRNSWEDCCSSLAAGVLVLHVLGYHVVAGPCPRGLLPIQLAAKAIEGWPGLWDLQPHLRAQRGSGLLASDQWGFGDCGHLGSGSINGRPFSLSLFLCVSFMINFFKIQNFFKL